MSILLVILELIMVDIILGGDNAVVIALATKNLDASVKTKATLYGAIGAILLRIVFIGLVLALGQMHIPFLFIIAGLALIYIALELVSDKEEEIEVKQESQLKKAVLTIIAADATMSFDNAIVIAAVAGTAGLPFAGEMGLVAFALLFSFPVILFGAKILSVLIEKFHFIIIFFGLILVHVALELIVKDVMLQPYASALGETTLKYGIWLLAIIIIAIKMLINKKKQAA